MSSLFKRVKVNDILYNEIVSNKEVSINHLNKMILESKYFSVLHTQNESIYFRKIKKLSVIKFKSIPKVQLSLLRLFDYLCMTKFMDSNDREAYLKKEKIEPEFLLLNEIHIPYSKLNLILINLINSKTVNYIDFETLFRLISIYFNHLIWSVLIDIQYHPHKKSDNRYRNMIDKDWRKKKQR
jgi:hypothetical protein